jgi:hypothetical protein
MARRWPIRAFRNAQMMEAPIAVGPELWNEDIGE